MSTFFSLYPFVRRSLTLAAFAGAGLAEAGAQTAPSTDSPATKPVDFHVASVPSRFANNTEPMFSSSNAEGYNPEQQAQVQLASAESTFMLPGAHAMQYGQRRRYGAPRYRGGNTNADGSSKYTGYAGVGLTLPTGDLHNYDTPSWGFQVGAGRNFNKRFGVNLEFAWDEFGIQGNVLQQQAYIEDPLNQFGLQGSTDGYSHIWSVSLQPVYNLKAGDVWGAYVTGGAGFYHKISTFTTPQAVVGYDYFGYPQQFIANEPFDSYTSNAPGFDGGFGVTYKFSRFANERLYAEARYVYVLNQQKAGINSSNYNSYGPNYNYPTTNLYPANSNRSSYIPVKFGIRF